MISTPAPSPQPCVCLISGAAAPRRASLVCRILARECLFTVAQLFGVVGGPTTCASKSAALDCNRGSGGFAPLIGYR